MYAAKKREREGILPEGRDKETRKKGRRKKKKTRDTKKITDKVTYTKGEEKAVYIYIERETRARF